MHIYKKRHIILGILSAQRARVANDETIDEDEMIRAPLGVSYGELGKAVNCNTKELKTLCSRCVIDEEIKVFKMNFEGFCVTEKGMTSFVDKKYLRELKNQRFETLKNWIQTIIPVLALLTTIFTIIYSNKRVSKQQIEIDKLKSRLEFIERHPKQ